MFGLIPVTDQLETLPFIFAKDKNLDWLDPTHQLGGNLITKAL